MKRLLACLLILLVPSMVWAEGTTRDGYTITGSEPTLTLKGGVVAWDFLSDSGDGALEFHDGTAARMRLLGPNLSIGGSTAGERLNLYDSSAKGALRIGEHEAGTPLDGTVEWTTANGFRGYDSGWVSLDTQGDPGGTDGQIQYNNGGVFGGFGLYDDATGHVGLGATPASRLHLGGTSYVDTTLTLERTSSNASSPHLTFLKSRSGGAVVDGDYLGGIIAQANDGDSDESVGAIYFVADGGVGDSDVPVEIQFWVAPDGSSTWAQQMGIKNDGVIQAHAYDDASTGKYRMALFDEDGNFVASDADVDDAGYPDGYTEVEVDIDFSASAEEDVTIALGKTIKEVIRGRVYIDVDPGAALDAYATYTFYSDSDYHGENAFYRTQAKLVYTEIDTAPTGGSPNLIPDDHEDFSPNDLIYIIDGGSSEFARLQTVAATMVCEDNVSSHDVDDGIVRVSEFSGFELFNTEAGTNIYCRVGFASAQTVSLKMVLLLRDF